MARLSSFDTSGLNIPPLAGYTLVKYAGSLTGRDFRAIAQVAPFVLHDLGLTEDQLHAWVALSALVSLVWQPDIPDINHYLVSQSVSTSKVPNRLRNAGGAPSLHSLFLELHMSPHTTMVQ